MKYWLAILACSLMLVMPADAQEDEFLGEEGEFEDPALLPVPAEPSAAERAAAAVAQQHGQRTQRASGAILRGLDKITGTAQDIKLETGEAFQYGRLELRLGECRYPQDDPSSDSYAEMTITDRRSNRTVFVGWMIASAPALSALDDARYDVWVISCNNV